MSARPALAAFLCAVLAACGSMTPPEHIAPPIGRESSQRAFLTNCEDWDDWEKPAPPFRIYGNSYYVGTCGIAAILIAGEDGHVLIDGASRGGGPLVIAAIERLGLDPADVKILLASHEHYDHVGGLAHIQQASGARMISGPDAATALRTGQTQPDDPQFGMEGGFAPVRVDGTVRGGERVSLGNLAIDAIATPGHTPGAMSWSWQSCEQDDCRTLVYMDSLSPISADGYRFSDHPDYLAGFRAGLASLAATPCDIPLTPHPSASAMLDRMARPGGLPEAGGCKAYAGQIAARLDKRIAEEQASK